VSARIDNDAAKAWAIFFARAVLGRIFFMAGCWKVFTLGPAGHVRRYFLPFEDTFLPAWSLWTVGSIITFIGDVADDARNVEVRDDRTFVFDAAPRATRDSRCASLA
jgi:hypothetical protein